jgi:ABC-2 type transport system permease protein
MRNIVTLLKKELLSFFYSPIAYIVMLLFLMISGMVFSLLFVILSEPGNPGGPAVMEFFFSGFFLWFYVVPLCPALTMRSFAEERRTGTIEVLLTAPITDLQTVVAKYLAAWFFYILLWVPTFLYVAILRFRFVSELDLGPVVSGYTGQFLIGGLFIAVGLLTSSLSRNQIVAYVTALVASVMLFLAGIFEYVVKDERWQSVFRRINMYEHMHSFALGALDTRYVIYYVSLIVFVLFLTVRAVESRKWR